MGRSRMAVPFILVFFIACLFTLQAYWPVEEGIEVEVPTKEEPTGAPEEPRSLTLEKVDNYPLYVLRLEGDYGFSEFLRTGVLNFSFGGPGPSCACFSASGNGSDPLFGRNFDFPSNPALLLFTDPPDGYASVSMVDLGYFGYSMGRLPEPDGDLEVLKMTPYLPFDGMNEHGLAVGMAAIPSAEPPYDSGRVTIGEIQVIRLLLDKARGVEEAISLLGEYNVEMTDPPIHYMLADRAGSSAIVEFIGGEMKVLQGGEPWQVMTNFIVHGSGAPRIVSCSRYVSAYDGLRGANGSVVMAEAMGLLEVSSQTSTIWSCVYNLETGDILIAMGRKYNDALSFQLPLAQ